VIARRKFMGGALAGLGALSIPLLARYRGFVDPRYEIRPEPSRLGGVGGPKRLVIFWNPQGNCSGMPTGDRFWPQGGELDFDLATSSVLAPLAKHAEDMILLRGLNDTYYTCGQTENGGVEDGQHGFGTFSRLTNVCPVKPGEDSLGGGQSIDQHLAEVIGGDTFVPSLVLSGAPGGTGNHRGFISYSGAGAPVVPQSDPGLLYGSLFSAATQGEDDEVAKKLRALRMSSLDAIKDDIAAIRARIPAAERHKMDAHLEGVRVLEKKYDESMAACVPPDAPPGDGLGIYPQRHALMFQMVAAALGCDLTRVVSLATSCGGGDNALDISHFGGWVDNYHSTGHASGGTADGVNSSQEECVEVMVDISRYYAEGLSGFVDLLKAMPEGEGSVFDNTLIVWCSEMAHGNHGNHDMPWVLIGGGWHFKTGRNLQLPADYGFPPVPVSKFGDLLVAIANAMGSPITTFGNPAWCDGPGGPLSALSG
jgi:hypothetical protein